MDIQLTEMWETTNVIALKIGKHWYTTKDILNDMVRDNKAEKMVIGRYTYWRKK